MECDVVAELMRRLGGLVGAWRGGGRGGFPTIDAFTYDEELVFSSNGVEPLIFYEQKTWDTTKRRDHAEPLHWEAGFIRPTEDGCVEVSNAQNGGRVEVLSGRLSSPDERGVAVLVLDSLFVGHDERIVRMSRRYEIAESDLSYEVEMATKKVPNLTTHLRASLRKC